MSEISNRDDIIDSRDVIARIEELESEFEAELEEDPKAEPSDELDILRKLAQQCEGYGDWRHGEALIRESHFEDYAQQLAEDIGAIKTDAGWPYTCIDWEQAAKELAMDYMEVDFDGVTYLMRS